MDVSGSVQDEYRLSVAFARAVSYGLDIDHDQARVGAVVFATDVNGLFYLGDNTRNREGVINSLDFFNDGGKTNTPAGLEIVRDALFTAAKGDRPGVPNVLVVMTDGYSNVNEERTPVDAEQLRNDGVTIYCVGVGEGPQLSEIHSIASSPSSEYVLVLISQGNPKDAADQLLDRLCR